MKCELITNLSKDIKEIAYIQSGLVISTLKYEEKEKLGQVFCEGDYFGLDSLVFGINLIDYYKVEKTRFKKESYQLFTELLKDKDYYNKFFLNLKITFLEIASFMKKREEEILLLNLRKVYNRSSNIKGLPKSFILNYIPKDKVNILLENKLIVEDEEFFYYNPE
ncbi:hypothetical protein [Marinitoga aeolica]|uniref:Cyclic nucleotide-binding domain-containing protein n=1 Tax=Marinitoga aeolica TaxID=2809031 RepID=A0ABY8PS34_9BACT|nr:hypothetical protein [Marinitoga aeolica]WGS65432.1 hypothetical protein JRV97_02420 [Marinitoga aeolica]